MITIAYETPEGVSLIKEFKQKRFAVNFMQKTFSDDVIASLTQGRCTGMIWGEGEIECDVAFSTFLEKPVYMVDEPDRTIKTKGKKR